VTVGRGSSAAVEAADEFLAEALARPPGRGVRQVTIPAPVVPPEALVQDDRPTVFWTAPGAPVHVGLGAAATVVGAGPDRFAGVRQGAARLWTAVETIDHPDAAGPVPRLFGGFSFLPGTRAPEWRQFGDAFFVLPRLLYTRDADAAYLSVTAVGGDGAAAGPPAALSEARQLLKRLSAGSPPDAGGARPAAPDGPSPAAEEHARAQWARAVESIQRRIRGGAAEKIVAARSRSLPLPSLDVGAVLRRLSLEGSTAARFAFRVGDSVFLGATPERLVARTGLEVRTEALAGSVPADSPNREARLQESLKDGAEHDYVVQAILDALAPLCERLEHPPEPRVQRLRHVLHLQTPFLGRLRTGVHVLELAERLHPTPAVGGLPKAEALAWIDQEEPGSRGWYAAPVGWFDADGDGEFGVALRSGLIHEGVAHLYAGAGIVRDSDARAEFEETEVKLRTMLDALGAPL
jgi:isochorismate synthase